MHYVWFLLLCGSFSIVLNSLQYLNHPHLKETHFKVTLNPVHFPKLHRPFVLINPCSSSSGYSKFLQSAQSTRFCFIANQNWVHLHFYKSIGLPGYCRDCSLQDQYISKSLLQPTFFALCISA